LVGTLVSVDNPRRKREDNVSGADLLHIHPHKAVGRKQFLIARLHVCTFNSGFPDGAGVRARLPPAKPADNVTVELFQVRSVSRSASVSRGVGTALVVVGAALR
jgi:hypothetical protein